MGMETKSMIIYGGSEGDEEKVESAPPSVGAVEESEPKIKSNGEKFIETMKDVAQGVGVAFLAAPEVIKQSNLMELIDWRFKNVNCPKKISMKENVRGNNPILDAIDDGTVVMDLLKGALSPIGTAIVREVPLKKAVADLANILENNPCHFTETLKLKLVTPGGKPAFITRHFMGKL